MTKEVALRQSTGIAGLDEVLHGGFIPERAYLIRGGPGTGKTTMGLHFLAAGATAGERVLLITFGEPQSQIRNDAARIGLNLEGVEALDLSPGQEFFTQAESYDIFSPAEVERDPTTRAIVEKIQSLKPRRVLVDAITQLRYLSTDAFQFHKQMLSFVRFLAHHHATAVLTSEWSAKAPDDDLQFMCDGVMHLGFSQHERTLEVSKFRGSALGAGVHSLRLGERGATVFPLLRAREFRRECTREPLSSGVPELDELLHGGLERGTVTIITGPSGVGKSTISAQFAKEAAGRGERSVIYCFEENRETLLARCNAINIPVSRMIEQGTLDVVKVDPLQMTPNEFNRLVRTEVEGKGANMVTIDSTMGYRHSFRSATTQEMTGELLALTTYLSNMGVSTLLANEVEYVTGDFRVTEIGISHLADNVIFLRYVEVEGQLRRTIGVLKKRLSNFEKTMREFEITRYGIEVGEPLMQLRGILSGNPRPKNAD